MLLGRYTGPSARLIAERLTNGLPKFSGGWHHVRGVCHKGDPRPDGGSLSLRDGPDRLLVHCFKDCDRRTIIEALERATGWAIWDSWESGERNPSRGWRRDFGRAGREVPRRPGTVTPSLSESKQKRSGDSATAASRHKTGCKCESCRVGRARKLWAVSSGVPLDSVHPARRWMAARNLYWPRLPVPEAFHWLDRSNLGPRHAGVGAIAVLFAPPAAWMTSWPKLPSPTAVELIHVDSEGRAALDRSRDGGGRPKRTHGIRRGAVAMLGNPLPAESAGLNLVEGSADALALAARAPETAAAVGGVGGMKADSLGDWLANWSRVNLYADNDTLGLNVARRLRRLLVGQDVTVKVYTLGASYKDPGEFAADNPLDTEVDLDAARDLASDLQNEGMPKWEAARLAIQTVGMSIGVSPAMGKEELE